MPRRNPNVTSNSDAPIRVEHQYDSETAPSIAIVRAIAVIENVDPMDSPTDLGVTLSDHFDPTALDRLVTETDGSSTLTIDLTIHDDHRYSVQVRGTGHLTVEKVVVDES